jgi:crotonobetainyl-CoA:carnitine CoA-transferase CaiB-like acyl-CoA transferase
MSGSHAAAYGKTGVNRERSANYFPGVVPAEQFESADGHFLIINATTQRVFERLCEAMGRPELIRDPLFSPRKNLLENHEAIHHIVGDWVGSLPIAECQAILDSHGVPACRVYATSDIVHDVHYAAREQVIEVESFDHGPVLQPGIVPRLTDTPGTIRHRAPMLGEHNDEIFRDLLGLTTGELEELQRHRII